MVNSLSRLPLTRWRGHLSPAGRLVWSIAGGQKVNENGSVSESEGSVHPIDLYERGAPSHGSINRLAVTAARGPRISSTKYVIQQCHGLSSEPSVGRSSYIGHTGRSVSKKACLSVRCTTVTRMIRRTDC